MAIDVLVVTSATDRSRLCFGHVQRVSRLLGDSSVAVLCVETPIDRYVHVGMTHAPPYHELHVLDARVDDVDVDVDVDVVDVLGV
jgi:hypothetical protein